MGNIKKTNNPSGHPFIPKLSINSTLFKLLIFTNPLISMLLLEYFSRGSTKEVLQWLKTQPNSVFLGYLIVFALFNIFLFIGKGKFYLITSLLMGFILSILGRISFIKTSLRGETLSILDYKLVTEAAGVAKLFNADMFKPMLIAAVVVCILILLIIFGTTTENTTAFRIVLSSIGVVILLVMNFSGINVISKWGIEIPADVNWNHDKNGFVLGNLIDSKFLKVPEPKGYNKEAIGKIYERMKENTQNTNTSSEKPNVVFVMNESFWDPTLAEGLRLNKDPLPNYRSLAKESVSGHISVPNIGGGTANTEYEVLTGLTKRFIKNYSVPYNPYNSYIYEPINSAATIFSNQGYKTTALHPYFSWFYRRNEVYKYLGFDKFVSVDELPYVPKYFGQFIEDSEVNTNIIDQIKASKDKDFIYAVTMQNHGPYDAITLKDKPIQVGNVNLSDKAKIEVENYINLIHHSDKNLGELIESLREYNEPTVVVFFGDHIPALSEETYTTLGFNTNEQQGHETPFLIWSNFETNKEKINLDANFLMPYVMNMIGENSDLYMNYLYSLYKQSPTVDMSSNAEMYKDYELLQYDIMHGKQYIYEFTGKPTVNPEYRLGENLKLDYTLVHKNSESYVLDIFGTGLNRNTSIFVNNEKMEFSMKNNQQISVFIPLNKINDKNKFEVKAEYSNAEGNLLKQSNTLSYTSIQDIEKQSQNQLKNTWSSIRLTSSYNWSVFKKQNDYTIIRANLNLDEVPYYIDKNGKILKDLNANKITQSDYSDIYSNKYLYLSISNAESGWGDTVTTQDISKYLDSNKYILNVCDTTVKYEKYSLDNMLNWEFFAHKNGYDIVRVNLNLEQNQYYIERNGSVLQNTNADKMSGRNQSDIYINGYLYVSIDSISGNKKPTKEQIQNYFKTNQYVFYYSK